MSKEQRAEIKELMRYYERRGWDWGPAVAYLSAKHFGVLDYVIHPVTRYGRRGR